MDLLHRVQHNTLCPVDRDISTHLWLGLSFSFIMQPKDFLEPPSVLSAEWWFPSQTVLLLSHPIFRVLHKQYFFLHAALVMAVPWCLCSAAGHGEMRSSLRAFLTVPSESWDPIGRGGTAQVQHCKQKVRDRLRHRDEQLRWDGFPCVFLYILCRTGVSSTYPKNEEE